MAPQQPDPVLANSALLGGQRALAVHTACRMCPVCEAVCHCKSHRSPSTQKPGGNQNNPGNSFTSLLLCLTKPSHRKPLCRLQREIKEGRTFFRLPCRLQGDVKSTEATPLQLWRSAGLRGPHRHWLLTLLCTGQHCLIMSSAQLCALYFAA